MISPKSESLDYNQSVSLEQSHISLLTLNALTTYYSLDPKDTEERESHLNKMNETHYRSGMLMHAIIDGIDSIEKQEDRDMVISLYSQEMDITIEEAEKTLEDGIEGMKVSYPVESGFCHVVDFNQLKGRLFVATDSRDRPYNAMLSSDIQINGALVEGGLSSFLGRLMGLEKEDLKLRITFGLEPKDAIEVCNRLQEVSFRCCESEELAESHWKELKGHKTTIEI